MQEFTRSLELPTRKICISINGSCELTEDKISHCTKRRDYVDKFMLRLKGIKDQLIFASEKISDSDYIIVVLSGLRADFVVIKTVILARDSIMSLKDFKA